MTTKQIAYKDYIQFYLDYYKNKKYPYQRYGQAFCNTFNITDPAIFYQEKDHEAQLEIEKYLLKEN